MTTRFDGYYDRLWRMLTKRLQYGGNKARNARRRIARIWGATGIYLSTFEEIRARHYPADSMKSGG